MEFQLEKNFTAKILLLSSKGIKEKKVLDIMLQNHRECPMKSLALAIRQILIFLKLGFFEIKITYNNIYPFQVQFSINFDKCIQSYHYHYNKNIDNFHHIKKFPHVPL